LDTYYPDIDIEGLLNTPQSTYIAEQRARKKGHSRNAQHCVFYL